MLLELKLLLMIGVANGTPVIAKRIFDGIFSAPLDFNRNFLDGRPLLGPSKTFRGLVSALVITVLCAPLLDLAWQDGFWIGTASMAGDLFSSFLKRRLGMPSSSMALGLDQIPESLFPALVGMYLFELSWSEVAIIVSAFFVLELVLSVILYKLKIRHEPY
jgi:CDP-2,3-bis-(O-geranylgeranyl)-sn-glycerol synthase